MRLSDVQKKGVKNCLEEISVSLTRISAERDLIKDILQRMHDEFEMEKKISRKLAKVYHKRSIEEEVATNEELSDIYSQIVPKE
jgi:hypothetical protein